jgi:hypothetical protein
MSVGGGVMTIMMVLFTIVLLVVMVMGVLTITQISMLLAHNHHCTDGHELEK